MKRRLFFVALLALSFTGFAQINNTNISNTALFAGEPYIAVNPTNPNNIVIAWMALDFSTNFRVAIKSKASFDGGTTWANQIIQPHFGPQWGSADPSMAFKNDGTLYLSYIDFREVSDSGGVYITKSTNGGVAWSAPIKVWDANTEDPTKLPLDRPWLVIDNSGTATDGNLYMTTKPAPWIPAPNRPYFKRSIDGGQTWSNYRYVDTTGYLVGNTIQAPMAPLTVAANGTLCIAYPSYLVSQSLLPKMLFAKSTNGGLGFQYSDIYSSTTPANDDNYKLGYRLGANPANANQMALTYIENVNGDPDIYLVTTNNGGQSWNNAVRVNDDDIGNGKAQDMVWLSYSNDGKLVLTWRDRRNGNGTGFFQPSDTYCAVSTDNGATFSPNLRLSNTTAAFDSILLQSGNDFMSCALVNDTIYSAWGDVRTGNLNIFFAKTAINSATGTNPIAINPEDEPLVLAFPNPASNKLQLKLRDKSLKAIDIAIYNTEGQQVLFKSLANPAAITEMDISNLVNGVYYMAAFKGKQLLSTQKILVAN